MCDGKMCEVLVEIPNRKTEKLEKKKTTNVYLNY